MYKMNHIEASDQAIKELRKLGGISKIILYGSVAKGTARTDSDIDIALILDDLGRMLPLDMEGFPLGYRNKVNELKHKLGNLYDCEYPISLYWESDYEKGIELGADDNRPNDILNEVGIVRFDSSYTF